jgi:hypothetical protein
MIGSAFIGLTDHFEDNFVVVHEQNALECSSSFVNGNVVGFRLGFSGHLDWHANREGGTRPNLALDTHSAPENVNELLGDAQS